MKWFDWTRRTAGACLWLACGLGFAAGCGSGSAPQAQLVAVTGKVTMGGSPLTGVAVSFIPAQQTRGTGAYGVTDAAGQFSLMHPTQKPGIEPGTYQVTFSKMVAKDGSPIPEGKTAADVEAVQLIPPPYSEPNPDSKINEVTVSSVGGAFEFDIPK